MSLSIGRASTGRWLTTIACELWPLLPLLGLYLVVVHFTASSLLQNDEINYAEGAIRLAGHPNEVHHVDMVGGWLWYGPGYPLVLVPFVLLKIPWIAAKYLNAGFLFGAIIYFYKLIRQYLPRTPALAAAICLGIHPPWMRLLPLLYTESLAYFLICGFLFHFCSAYNSDKRRGLHLAAASLFLAYLALTKVFFGYVIVFSLLLLLGVLLWRRTHSLMKAMLVFLLAFVCCLPYLTYTFSLTGRVFYWGTSGGMNLYWMTTPYPNELGSWFDGSIVSTDPRLAPHRDLYEKLQGLSDVERDDLFKTRALFNITHYPKKYVINWAANVGRLLFSYPYSYTPQSLSSYFYMLPNMFLVVLFVLSGVPAALRLRSIPFEIWAILIFGLVAIGGSTLLYAQPRQFEPLVPVLWTWISFVYVRALRIEFRTDREP